MSYFCINKTGSSYQVFDVDKNAVVGTLYNREAYILIGSEGCLSAIQFLGPSGTMINAMINTYTHPFEHTWCDSYRRGTANITFTSGGQTYTQTFDTYIMRRSMPVYTAAGNRWGTVAANVLVAADDAVVGDSHPTWKKIYFVQQSPNLNWVKVDGDDYNYGFVDTGLSSNSSYSSIPFYGSW